MEGIEIYSLEEVDLEGFDLNWSMLWWDDFQEAGIVNGYFAFDGFELIGFQTINIDGLCVTIEVHPAYQGMGIASALISQSGCNRPDRNECPEFWSKFVE